MKNNILYPADTRGYANHGWLESHQTFSFADYYNPDRIRFGVLRVLNDDRVDGGKGFGSHPHENMEIISIPLEGSLVHEDNLGNRRVVSQGEVQVMSTGTGVFHSEYNNNPEKPAKFLQIWVFPNQLNVEPRYDQIKLDPTKEHNQLQQIISPSREGEGTWIYQDAWFHIGRFGKWREITYDLKKKGNGIFLFVINGSFVVDGQSLHQPDGQILNARDGLGIRELDRVSLTAQEEHSELLIIEVPMDLTSN
jgi:quercetin 2,3-dioxygenase